MYCLMSAPMNQYDSATVVWLLGVSTVRLSATVCCDTCDAIARIFTAAWKVYAWLPTDALRCL